mmetsp:Transcript_10831/g.12739  ORF Transcript_10831/g.12739 Transcript_10831/m.12739 type:complete len:237 (+) Transcript_10831:289-999(+)
MVSLLYMPGELDVGGDISDVHEGGVTHHPVIDGVLGGSTHMTRTSVQVIDGESAHLALLDDARQPHGNASMSNTCWTTQGHILQCCSVSQHMWLHPTRHCEVAQFELPLSIYFGKELVDVSPCVFLPLPASPSVFRLLRDHESPIARPLTTSIIFTFVGTGIKPSLPHRRGELLRSGSRNGCVATLKRRCIVIIDDSHVFHLLVNLITAPILIECQLVLGNTFMVIPSPISTLGSL